MTNISEKEKKLIEIVSIISQFSKNDLEHFKWLVDGVALAKGLGNGID